jgi:hypothetical protein
MEFMMSEAISNLQLIRDDPEYQLKMGRDILEENKILA